MTGERAENLGGAFLHRGEGRGHFRQRRPVTLLEQPEQDLVEHVGLVGIADFGVAQELRSFDATRRAARVQEPGSATCRVPRAATARQASSYLRLDLIFPWEIPNGRGSYLFPGFAGSAQARFPQLGGVDCAPRL